MKASLSGNEGRALAQPLFIKIADIMISLFSEDPELKLGAEGPMKKFLAEGRESDVSVRVGWGDCLEESKGRKLFDAGALWQLYHEDGSYFFRFTSSALGPLPYKVSRFDLEYTSGNVYLRRQLFKSGQPIYPLEYPLDELLIVNLLARGKGVVVHACGIVDPHGKGHLFVGQSEAGKTTIAKLWQNEPNITVLSDDRIILRKIDKTIWMYGTPWHGEAELASPAQVPVRRIYFLRHGEKNELFSQRPVDALARLFACSFPPFYNRDALDFTLGFLEDVVINVPCYGLKFKPDKSVVEFIQEERFT